MAKKLDDEGKYLLEEALEDLQDALTLLLQGGMAMAAYHAAQSAQKALGALGIFRGQSIPLIWDIARVANALKDDPVVLALAEPVALLSHCATPAKTEKTPSTGAEAIQAAKQVFIDVCLAISYPIPDEIEALVVPEIEEPLSEEDGQLERSERRPLRPYVRAVLFCRHCGVRLPRTRQTARRFVPCPLCNRNMQLLR